MLDGSRTFNGFAVDDAATARDFYGQTLGLEVATLDEENGLLELRHGDDRNTLIYQKSDFVPATYTILNFAVDDIDAAVDDLSTRGIRFDRYEGFDQDEKGIARGNGPNIAWFKDPAGNVLSVLEQG
jgi:catechol 2,3-dioxygenase-like lactoylglutathione lyase family enzyme